VCGRKPPGRGYHQAWLRDSRLFVHGGFDGKEIYNDLYFVDLAACAYLPQITSFGVEVSRKNQMMAVQPSCCLLLISFALLLSSPFSALQPKFCRSQSSTKNEELSPTLSDFCLCLMIQFTSSLTFFDSSLFISSINLHYCHFSFPQVLFSLFLQRHLSTLDSTLSLLLSFALYSLVPPSSFSVSLSLILIINSTLLF